MTPSGEYAIEHTQRTGIPRFVERGYIIGDQDQLLFRPVEVHGDVQRLERVAAWLIIPNDIEALIIDDPLYGEFSYVRAP